MRLTGGGLWHDRVGFRKIDSKEEIYRDQQARERMALC